MHQCLWAAAFLATSACAFAPSSTGDGQEPTPSPVTPSDSKPSGISGSGSNDSAHAGINGTLLYAKQLGPDHTVDFYEFEEGTSAVHESLSVDNGEVPFIDKATTFSSLAEAYAKLNPTALEVPAAIRQADLRTQARVAPAANLSVDEAPTDGSAALSHDLLSGAASTCSADAFGDNWGADWFLNNFCITGNFRWCKTNQGWAESGQYAHSWSRWNQFEGDFNLTGHITATGYSCSWFWGCGLRTTIIDYDVLPRRLESWTFTGTNNHYWFRGTSQCGHLHVAFLYN
jgi:hypothetical protein